MKAIRAFTHVFAKGQEKVDGFAVLVQDENGNEEKHRHHQEERVVGLGTYTYGEVLERKKRRMSIIKVRLGVSAITDTIKKRNTTY